MQFALIWMVPVLELLAVAFERQTLTTRFRRAKSAVRGSLNRSNTGAAPLSAEQRGGTTHLDHYGMPEHVFSGQPNH